MTNASIGYQATFGIGDGGSPEAFTDVAEVVTITPPAMARESIDATHLESPNKYKEFIAGLAESGDATITINFVPSTTDVLVTAFEAESGNFRITFPNAVTMTFSGIVTGYEVGELSLDKMTATFTVKATGQAALA